MGTADFALCEIVVPRSVARGARCSLESPAAALFLSGSLLDRDCLGASRVGMQESGIAVWRSVWKG